MAKKARSASRAVTDTEDVPVVGMREPCPCGSGRRYKACHGREAARGVQPNARPFEGMANECDWVAMRELVPAATAPLTLNGEAKGRTVTVATILPLAWPAVVTADKSVLLGLQVTTGSGDASRDYAEALTKALDAEEQGVVSTGRVTLETPLLQDIVDCDAPLQVTVHEDFDFWTEAIPEEFGDDIQASLERARSYTNPTAKLASVDSAYWTQMGAKEHLRWIMPTPEDQLLDALARLHAAGADDLGPDSRYVGMFRACGVVAPVWDLPYGMGADAVEQPASSLAERLAEALADDSPLNEDQRRARAGLTNRQVTLR